MLIGLVGLPNKGKSTLFNALTHSNAQVANYPFTTIKPNEGVAFATKECPHVQLGLGHCDPKNSACENGIRKIPVKVLDVAGLVSGASNGKGMGNQFLNDLSRADALIVVADASGQTDDEGNPAQGHDGRRDVEILEQELDAWFTQVVTRNAQKTKGNALSEFIESLSGLNVEKRHVMEALAENNIPENSREWNAMDLEKLAESIRKKTKPLVVAANKMDLKGDASGLEALGYPVFSTSGEMALAKQKAVKNGFANEQGGKLVPATTDPKIVSAIEKINAFGNDGVQALLDHVVFDVLNQIVVFPVEDETHYANHFGKILPDAFLLKKGSTPMDLAEKVHSDLKKGFLYAVDAKTKRRLGKDSELQDGAVVKIVSAK
ncbi:redox-regulated ATPase YchF [Candidatus Micrarchaeota archaeon]|nr:redox-regulated ATPase YchF [Candidatus Micrarchaeota archaeon]